MLAIAVVVCRRNAEHITALSNAVPTPSDILCLPTHASLMHEVRDSVAAGWGYTAGNHARPAF